MTTCDVCGKGIERGPMFRVNPLGQAGIFRHKECGGIPADKETEDICNLINSGGTALPEPQAAKGNR